MIQKKTNSHTNKTRKQNNVSKKIEISLLTESDHRAAKYFQKFLNKNADQAGDTKKNKSGNDTMGGNGWFPGLREAGGVIRQHWGRCGASVPASGAAVAAPRRAYSTHPRPRTVRLPPAAGLGADAAEAAKPDQNPGLGSPRSGVFDVQLPG